VRRSEAKTGPEKFLRRLGIHFFRCRECQHRGRKIGALPGRESSSGSGARHSRDRMAARRERGTVLAAFVLAAVLGLGAGVYLHSCRGGETAAAE